MNNISSNHNAKEQVDKIRPIDVAKEIFNTDDEQYLDLIIWSCTGWPCFWSIPKDGNTPEECFRTQLKAAKIALEQGYSIDDIFEGKNEVSL